MNPICLSRFGEAKGEKKIGFQSVLCQLPDCEYQCSHSFGLSLFFFPRSPAIQLVGLLLSTFVDYIVFGNAMMNLASLGKYGRC